MKTMKVNWKFADTLWIFWITQFLFNEINSIKITKMRVPSTYIIEPANKNPLILDCEYDIDPQKETMFVLKWLFNKAQIYQWIPPRPPRQFVAFKNHVNVSYVASPESLHQHRAVFISKPAWNLTGQYTCSVSTLTSNDKQTLFLQIIVAEAEFKLNYKTDMDRFVNIRCSAFKVYPEPVLEIVLDNDSQLMLSNKSRLDTATGMYFVSIHGRIHQSLLKSETSINCVLSIPGTNYTRRKEAIYYEQQPEPDLLVTETDELVEAIFSLSSKPFSNFATSINWCCCYLYFAMLVLTMLRK